MKRVLALLVVAMMLVMSVPIAMASDQPFADAVDADADITSPVPEGVVEYDTTEPDDDDFTSTGGDDAALPTGEDEDQVANTEVAQIAEPENAADATAETGDVNDDNLTESTVSADAITQALEAAANDSSKGEIAAVTVKAATKPGSTGVAVSLDSDAFTTLADTGKDLTLETENGKTQFSAAALSSLKKLAGSEEISIERKVTAGSATEKGSFGIGGFVVEMNFKAGNEKIHQLGGDVSLSVEIPDESSFEAVTESGEKVDLSNIPEEGVVITIQHVIEDENGKLVSVPMKATLKRVGGKLVVEFKTNSFSSFVFTGFKPVDSVSPVNVAAETVEASASANYGMILSVVLGVAAVAVFVFTQKKRV